MPRSAVEHVSDAVIGGHTRSFVVVVVVGNALPEWLQVLQCEGDVVVVVDLVHDGVPRAQRDQLDLNGYLLEVHLAILDDLTENVGIVRRDGQRQATQLLSPFEQQRSFLPAMLNNHRQDHQNAQRVHQRHEQRFVGWQGLLLAARVVRSERANVFALDVDVVGLTEEVETDDEQLERLFENLGLVGDAQRSLLVSVRRRE